jgi:hypothetical protein
MYWNATIYIGWLNTDLILVSEQEYFSSNMPYIMTQKMQYSIFRTRICVICDVPGISLIFMDSQPEPAMTNDKRMPGVSMPAYAV